MISLSQLKGCDAMRRLVAHHAHAYRHGAPQQERPTPSVLGGLLDAACGKPANSLEIKARQEVELLSGLLTPVQQSHTSACNLIIRPFCTYLHKKEFHS